MRAQHKNLDRTMLYVFGLTWVCVRMCAIELNECLAFTLIELDLLNEAISISTN